MPTCVASQASLEKTALTLGLSGLSEYFPPAARFSSRMVEHGKPDPALFLLAAESMGFEPHRCVVIEDGVLGVQAARRAGMPVLGYAPEDGAERLASAGAQVFGAMDELPELLASL
jgi:beta-phosphoglucomutase-like phosphatase (HAD superfamily)